MQNSTLTDTSKYKLPVINDKQYQSDLNNELSCLLDSVQNQQGLYSDKSDRVKSFGQFFTNQKIAPLMAQFAKLKTSEVSFLDAGAGLGMLSISLTKELISQGATKVNILLYEIDHRLIEKLHDNLNSLQSILQRSEIELSFQVQNLDFVKERPDLNSDRRFDFAILNPPYFKINSESEYFNLTQDLYSGNPNIYAAFIGISLGMLKEEGQLIAITPRSFTNGLYFKNFRNFILHSSSLDNIHSFTSRDKLFSQVLQEVLIYKLTLQKKQSDIIQISQSQSHEDLKDSLQFDAHKGLVIDNRDSNLFIRVPENQEDLALLSLMGKLPNTFNDLGYFISTGEVVRFRTKEYLTEKKSKNTIKVIVPKDIKPSNDVSIKPNSLFFKKRNGYRKHLTLSSNYVVIRRFSSKDDKKRLIASIINPTKDNTPIGIDNHLNYIGFEEKGRGLNKPEQMGLFGLFNSSLYEKYFRCISGNTQVNATEIRQMNFPTRKSIILIGNKLIELGIKKLNQEQLDNIINQCLETEFS